jgi:hypothetical protein
MNAQRSPLSWSGLGQYALHSHQRHLEVGANVAIGGKLLEYRMRAEDQCVNALQISIVERTSDRFKLVPPNPLPLLHARYRILLAPTVRQRHQQQA